MRVTAAACRPLPGQVPASFAADVDAEKTAFWADSFFDGILRHVLAPTAFHAAVLLEVERIFHAAAGTRRGVPLTITSFFGINLVTW